MSHALMVMDLDSLVIDERGAVGELDRAAIARARRAGVGVAFATSRRATTATALLRAASLEGWVIGADGAHIAQPRDGRVLARSSLPSTVAARVRELILEVELSCFALTSEGVHGDAHEEELATNVFGLAADVYSGRRPLLAEIAALVGVGSADRVREISGKLADLAPSRIEHSIDPVGEHGAAIRVHSRRACRSRAIADLAARIGARRAQLAYIGGARGPYVDRSPFRDLPRVFCPPEVGPDIAPHAERLRSRNGGAVAEAIERWLPPGVLVSASS